jgi:small-conductance mechanosensitive channel/CRP-like cAMP-binding protein
MAQILIGFIAVVALSGLELSGIHRIATFLGSDEKLVQRTIGIALAIAMAFLADGLVREYFWRGYLRRRLGRDTPTLIQDMFTGLIVLVGLAAGLAIESVSVVGIVTASGFTALGIGYVLQDVIKDVFSGLSISLEGFYANGDWLTVYAEGGEASFYGRVIRITRRTTVLETEDGNALIVPNHLMTTRQVLNHSKPLGPRRFSVELSIDNRIPSARVMDMLFGEALKAVRQPGLAKKPDPVIAIQRVTDSAIVYEIFFYAYPDKLLPALARSTMLDALLDVVQQSALPSPIQQVELTEPLDPAFVLGDKEKQDALARSDLFSGVLNGDQLATLAERSHCIEVKRGTVLMKQGDAPTSMLIVLEGAASITVKGATGDVQEVAVSATGDVIGEMTLMTGEPRSATAIAMSRLRAIEIGKPIIAEMLEKSPQLVARFSAILEQRQRELATLAEELSIAAPKQSLIEIFLKHFRLKQFAASHGR